VFVSGNYRLRRWEKGSVGKWWHDLFTPPELGSDGPITSSMRYRSGRMHTPAFPADYLLLLVVGRTLDAVKSAMARREGASMGFAMTIPWDLRYAGRRSPKP